MPTLLEVRPSVPVAPAVTDTPRRRPGIRRFAIVVCLLFSALCTAPYVVADHRTPADATFTGLILNPYDQEYYLAAERTASEDLPRQNRYTTEEGAPGPVARIYPLLGKVSRWTDLSHLAVYHTARTLAVVALPFALLALFALCFPDDRRRQMLATVLALFSVGLHTVLPAIAGGEVVGDNLPEASVLYSGMTFPHFALSYLALVLALTALIAAWHGAGARRIGVTALTAGILFALNHAFLLLPVTVLFAGALGLGLVWRRRCWRRAGRLVLAGAACLGPAIPALFGLIAEAEKYRAFQGRGFPNTPAASWPVWLAQYAILLPLAVAGAIALIRRPRSRWGSGADAAAASCAGALGCLLAVLIFVPFTPFQRRFSEGLVVPLALFAAVSLAYLPRLRQILIVGSVLAVAVVGAVRTSTHTAYMGSTDPVVFHSIESDDVVLAGDGWAPRIPSYSDGTVYVGRLVETMRYDAKRAVRDAFAADPSDTDTLRTLRAAGVTLVLIDTADPSFLPRTSIPNDCFVPALHVGTVSGYRLSAACGA